MAHTLDAVSSKYLRKTTISDCSSLAYDQPMFKCETSGKCIPNEFRCDDYPNDCRTAATMDNSDEENCPSK